MKSADSPGRHVSVDLIRAVRMSSISWLVRGTEQTTGVEPKGGLLLLIHRASFNSSVGFWGRAGNTIWVAIPGATGKASGRAKGRQWFEDISEALFPYTRFVHIWPKFALSTLS